MKKKKIRYKLIKALKMRKDWRVRDLKDKSLGEEEQEEIQKSQVVVKEEEEEEGDMFGRSPLESGVFENPLQCRNIMIGSFKVHPKASNSYLNVFLQPKSLSFYAPTVSDPNKIVKIILKPCDVTLMCVHFGRCLPIVFISTTPSFGRTLRESLSMTTRDNPYFDPTSNDGKQRKIIFLLDQTNEEQCDFLQHGFLPDLKVQELTQSSAHEILVGSTPNKERNYFNDTCSLMSQTSIPHMKKKSLSPQKKRKKMRFEMEIDDESLEETEESEIKEEEESLEEDESLKEEDESFDESLEDEDDESLEDDEESLEDEEESLEDEEESIEEEEEESLEDEEDEILEVKDEILEVKDEILEVKDEILEMKDESLEVKDESLKVKDESLEEEESLDDEDGSLEGEKDVSLEGVEDKSLEGEKDENLGDDEDESLGDENESLSEAESVECKIKEEKVEVPFKKRGDKRYMMDRSSFQTASGLPDAPLQCCLVKIGSFKVRPVAFNSYITVLLQSEGLSFMTSTVTDSKKIVKITLKPPGITAMCFHFGKSFHIFFIYTTPSAAESIRKALNMNTSAYPYFDPASNDEKQKKIIFLIRQIMDDQRNFLQHDFLPEKIVQELDHKSANEILVQSTSYQASIPRMKKKSLGTLKEKMKVRFENESLGKEEIEESEIKEEEVSCEEGDVGDMLSRSPIKTATSFSKAPLLCRSVRIGTFKILPKDSNSYMNVFLKPDGLSFNVPTVTDSKKIVKITLKPRDITIMYVHFGKHVPIVFIYVTPSVAEKVRKSLHMTTSDPYLDPASYDEKQKKITFVIYRTNAKQRHFLLNGFLPNKVQELDQESANAILRRSTPQTQVSWKV